MGQVYEEQTDNAFTRAIASAIAKNATKINLHLTNGANDSDGEVNSHFETIGQLLELREAVASTEPAYVVPLVRSRCGESAPS